MTQKASAKNTTRIEHEQKAIKLRMGGATYGEIGKQLGITGAGAHKMVMRVLARDAAQTAEDAPEVLRVELMRLDRMQLGLWQQAKAGNQGAVDRVLRIMDRRSKYLGLDAPERREITGSDGGPIEYADYRAALEQRLALIVERTGEAAVPGEPE
jgi:hypothetical protein